MFRKIITCAALATAAAFTMTAPGLATESGNLDVTGYLQFEGFATDGGNSDAIGFGTFDLTYGFGSPDAPVGLELDAFAMAASDGFVGGVVEGGVYFDALGGRIVVGAPRSAFETLRPRSGFEYMGLFEAEFVLLTRSTPLATQFVFGNFAPGVRYDRVLGQTDVSLSYHYVQLGGSGAHTVAASARHDFGALTASAGVETVFDGSVSETSYFAGLEGRSGWGDYGLTYVNNQTFFGGAIVSGYFDRQINDRLTIGAIGMVFLDSSSDHFLGAQAHYTFGNNAYVHAAVVTEVDLSGWFASLAVGTEF